jgi:8-oxo-dGTP pyrophosphatase MutT (NUDIX family)
MGGNFVYPGGRVDLEDGSMEICNYSKGVTLEEACRMFGKSLSAEESFAHWIAGIRELFEEAGVLLAYDERGNLVEYRSEEEKLRFMDDRDRLQKGKKSICQIARESKIFLALDQLHYYAHWITPEARSERFDTRFFIARHPKGQEACYDQKETTEGVWLSPGRALEENLRRKIALSPPTLKTLEDLSRFKTIEEIFLSLKTKEITPILPVLIKISYEHALLLPWDAEYEIFRKGETPASVNHGRPSQPGDNTTRLILRGGIWYPYYHTK